MKLSTKLIVSFAVVILLVGGIGITSSYVNETVKNQVTTESKEAIKEIELAGEMGLQLYRSLTRAQYLLEDKYRQSLSADFSEGGVANEVVVENIDNSLDQFHKSLQNTREFIQKDQNTLFRDTTDTKEVLVLLNKLEKKYGIYASLINQLKKLSSENHKDGKEFFTVTIEPYFRTNLLPLIDQLRKEMQIKHQQKIASLNQHLAWVSCLLGIATIFALLIAISITFFLYRSIANPIKKLVSAAQSIAQGNLEERIDFDSTDELGQLSQTFNNMAESLSRTTVSRNYVDSIIESMEDLLIVTDADYRITRINSAGLAVVNQQEDELLGQPVQSLFKNGKESSLFNDNEDDSTKIKDEELLTEAETPVPVNVSKGFLKDRGGNSEGYVIVASDISSEKRAQEKIKESLREKEVLLAEIHHRVKNNLAVISGLLQMQLWETENEYAASALQQSHMRVRSIAMVHEQLYQSKNLSHIEFNKYTKDLLGAISSSYMETDSNIELVTDMENIVLNVNKAIPCSLLINEWVANAYKNASDIKKEGKITVSMSKSGKQVTLCIKNNGRVFSMSDDSMDMSLIDTLGKQLHGELQIRNDNGAEVAVSFEA